MTEKLTELNEALPGILIIDLIYLMLGEGIIFLFIPNPALYETGFLAGVICAVVCVFHMSFQIRKVVYEGSGRTLVTGSITRMGFLFVVFVILHYFNLGDLFAAFIGMLAMKLSAYLEPSIRGITSRFYKKGG